MIIARHLGFAVEQRRTEARRLQAEETLRLRERRLTAMFQQAGVGMALIGAQGQIIAANPAFARICGRPLGELVGVDCEAFTHPNELEESRRSSRATVWPNAMKPRAAQEVMTDVMLKSDK